MRLMLTEVSHRSLGRPFSPTAQPRRVDSNCASNRVFVASAGSNLVDAFVMAADGSLTPVAGSPFPSGGTSTINALTLTPNNQNLLTSNVFNRPFRRWMWGRMVRFSRSRARRLPRLTAWDRLPPPEVANLSTPRSSPGQRWTGGTIRDDGTLRPVPGRPFPTGQGGAGVQALTTFPAPSCSATQ